MAQSKRTKKSKAPARRKGKKKTRAASGRRGRIAVAFWALALCATAFCLFLAMNLPPRGSATGQSENVAKPQATAPRPGSAEPDTGKAVQKRPEVSSASAQSSNGRKGRTYEETLQGDLVNKIREVEVAIVQNLILIGIDPSRIEHRDLRLRRENGSKYFHQSLVLPLKKEQKKRFLENLERYLDRWLDRARLRPLPDGNWEVSVWSVPTHTLAFRSTLPRPSRPGRAEKPRMALVIDDMGESLHKAQKLIQTFGDDITLSILPYCHYTHETAELASKRGLEFMLHLPMEPVGYPEVDPGPGSLYVNMDKAEIESVLRDDIRQIPGLVGVNNHMGSRFTSHAPGMRVVFRELKQRDLFFMDSLTIAASKGKEVGRRVGLTVVSRDIFIDNEQEVESILFQLKKAEQYAKQHGKALVIGHPYPETIQALDKWSRTRDSDVQLCKLSDLIPSDGQHFKEDIHDRTDVVHHQTRRPGEESGR